MTKKLTRNAMREKLTALDEMTYTNYSRQIEEQFLRYIASSDASTIALTISSFPEVNTWGIIKQLWVIGKNVVVPKCKPSDKSMIFYQIQNFDQLERVYMHLLEPNPLLTKAFTPQEIDLIVVPGIVYNEKGYRIGFGGGYYDRFLMNYHGDTLSLAFQMQVVEDVETNVFDLPVDKIITQNEILLCKQNREKDE
ncbi:5-formyltetrahydrofolate cyclo-ligase [Psychrobacillus sp. OK028]|uniref:5-formyltetrahydrofolate cyclo-ligase n=1 Tax=Psychrobacillus sp. OK028 TaxID=1884359 RepID=UPI00088B58C9|nr:5-formyltetrahydrofolate cyclo-ligase [Psychrobacillus sp. OK028]SDM86384.1 5-formyltetrahydrofolate cyclo-ligase [Psychrobacillus sp. OK028]